MKYSVVNRPAVREDILAVIDYYKEISPKLAFQFLKRIREARKYIERNPLSFALKYKNVRTVLLRQFPYHIHFLIDEDKQMVVILAVIHAYRNPSDYSGR